MGRGYNSSPYAFTVWWLIKHRENFIIIFIFHLLININNNKTRLLIANAHLQKQTIPVLQDPYSQLSGGQEEGEGERETF